MLAGSLSFKGHRPLGHEHMYKKIKSNYRTNIALLEFKMWMSKMKEND